MAAFGYNIVNGLDFPYPFYEYIYWYGGENGGIHAKLYKRHLLTHILNKRYTVDLTGRNQTVYSCKKVLTLDPGFLFEDFQVARLAILRYEKLKNLFNCYQTRNLPRFSPLTTCWTQVYVPVYALDAPEQCPTCKF